MMSRDEALQRDAQDPLAPLREAFALPEGILYLDGHSLGPLPRLSRERLIELLDREWGQGLIRSWNDADWIGLPQRVGDAIGQLIGAGPGETIAADSTSINLFKLLAAALALQADADPARCQVLAPADTFPTDLYIAEGLGALPGGPTRLQRCTLEALPQALGPQTAVLMLAQVDFRTGALLDMTAWNAAAHAAGALTVWDLSHSAGALPIDLHAAGSDFAVGCGYKYLNGGPGAPAFAWAHPRHAGALRHPLTGWMGHAEPFAFEPGYRPAPGIRALLCGTPPVLSMAALEQGVAVHTVATSFGGMPALRAKSMALSQLLIDAISRRCAGHGLELASPADPSLRGSHVSFRHPHAWPISQALAARGVIGDFRAPDLLRFGIAPLYLRYADMLEATERLAGVLETGAWRDEEFLVRRPVT